ncbi:sortase-like acyltransferase [Lachnospiraceae bacterium JC7]|nr:sortase-like acyltransferase [Lachnospiraceae bacterium JC7]
MKIRNSKETDFNRIMEIYAFARDFMAKTGNPYQWGPTNWPPETLIRDDIKNGQSYVCTDDDDKIIGTFFFKFGNDIEPAYRDIIDGEWSEDAAYGVVHRIATDGSVKGTGKYCLDWAYERSGYLRIDTHPDNVVMQKLLNKLGFKRCGIIHVMEDNYPRYAYEKREK